MADVHFYALCGILGVVFHTLLKYQSLSKDAEKANTSLSFNQFVKKDWVGIVLSILPVALLLMTVQEVSTAYPKVRNFLRLTFFLTGGLGSYVLQLALSRSKQQIRRIVDVKTNKADGIEEANPDTQ